MLCAGQEREFTVFPGVVDGGGIAIWGNQGGHQDIGIKHDAHQGLVSLLSWARRSARTAPTASSTRAWTSSGSMPALRSLISCTIRLKTRQRTASSMNFERSPFLIPWEPRKVRRTKSVSFETLMFQRTASSICVYTLKQINIYLIVHNHRHRSKNFFVLLDRRPWSYPMLSDLMSRIRQR